jgi:hypothetical protein
MQEVDEMLKFLSVLVLSVSSTAFAGYPAEFKVGFMDACRQLMPRCGSMLSEGEVLSGDRAFCVGDVVIRIDLCHNDFCYKCFISALRVGAPQKRHTQNAGTRLSLLNTQPCLLPLYTRQLCCELF